LSVACLFSELDKWHGWGSMDIARATPG